MSEWAEWESGDCLYAPDQPNSYLEPAEILRRIAVGFRRAAIDWTEGDRWVESRISKALKIGYRGVLLEAENALRTRSVLVSLADEAGVEAAWVRFFMTPDTGSLELHYEPNNVCPRCRALATKLAELLGYEFVPWEPRGQA